MFISKAEKNVINERIAALEAQLHILTFGDARFQNSTVNKNRKWSDASRAALSGSMKKSWAERKAKKEAA